MVNARISSYHTLLSAYAQERLLAGGTLTPQVEGKWKKKLHVAWEAMSMVERASVAAALRMPGELPKRKPRGCTPKNGIKKPNLRLVHSVRKVDVSSVKE